MLVDMKILTCILVCGRQFQQETSKRLVAMERAIMGSDDLFRTVNKIEVAQGGIVLRYAP